MEPTDVIIVLCLGIIGGITGLSAWLTLKFWKLNAHLNDIERRLSAHIVGRLAKPS